MSFATLHRFGALTVVLFAAVACRTTRQGDRDLQPTLFAASIPPNAERQRDILPLEEIRGIAAHTAYEAVVRLRPEFLGRRQVEYDDFAAPRANRSAIESAARSDDRYPTVFLNGTEQGGLASLRTIPAGGIVEIRYYHAMHVPPVYGVNHPGGVIDVRTTP